jgi:hypothetical protein
VSLDALSFVIAMRDPARAGPLIHLPPYGACGGNPLIVESNPEFGAARYGNWLENDLSF